MSRNAIIRAIARLTCLMLAVNLLSGAIPVQARPEVEWPGVAVVQRYSGFVKPLGVTSAGDGSGRLFITEQEGRIRVVKGGQLLAEPFLDLSDQVLCCGERGLLGLTFPPGFSQKQYFYVFYSDLRGASVIARFWVSDQNPDRADPLSKQNILSVVQSGATHKGGQLAFGPDDYLYISLGDGKYSELPDINMNSQNPGSLLGKILRIDTESWVAPPQQPTQPVAWQASSARKVFLPAIVSKGLLRYRIPPGNPFVGQPSYRDEIWALGLRNPWRFSFDRQTGDLFVSDVGLTYYEEVDFQPAGSQGGQNYGWPIMTGNHCYIPSVCNTPGLTSPVMEYQHVANGRCAVIGGYVYRGQAFAALRGIYQFGDYCTGEIWGMQRVSGVWQSHLLVDTSLVLTSFGEDEAGNVFVTDYFNGILYQIMPATE